jgi:hypothetical protein
MTGPYMMQPSQYAFSPLQQGNFFPPQNISNMNMQNMNMQPGYNPMFSQKIPQNNPQITSNPQPNTSTGSSKFSLDAPVYTPKNKSNVPSSGQNTSSNYVSKDNQQKETVVVQEPIKEIVVPLKQEETPVVVAPIVVPERKIETVPVEEKSIQKEQIINAPIVSTIVEESPEKKEVVQSSQNVQQSTSVNKPAEQPQQKKSGLSGLLSKGSGVVIKSTPAVVTQTANKQPPKKSDTDNKFSELQKKLNKTKSSQDKKPAPATTTLTKQRESYTQSYNVEEEEIKVPEPEPEPEEKWETVRHYFKVSSKKKEETKKSMGVDFLMAFRDWKISKETILIEDLLKNHIKRMEEYSDEFPKKSGRDRDKGYGQKKGGYDRYSNTSRRENEPQPNININTKEEVGVAGGFSRQTTAVTENKVTSIAEFARRDLTKENKEAEQFKDKIDKERQIDPIKDELQM